MGFPIREPRTELRAALVVRRWNAERMGGRREAEPERAPSDELGEFDLRRVRRLVYCNRKGFSRAARRVLLGHACWKSRRLET